MSYSATALLTPSIVARDCCVSGNSLRPLCRRTIKIHRLLRCSIVWSWLQRAVARRAAPRAHAASAHPPGCQTAEGVQGLGSRGMRNLRDADASAGPSASPSESWCLMRG